MRDTVKTEEYFRERYNKDAYYLDKWMSEYQETISHLEKYNIGSYKYTAFTYASKKFYSGYSLGLGMNELLPEVDLIIRNLIDAMEEMDSGYDNMALIIYLIILFNRTEFLDEYKELLIKSEYWDVYLENLIQILDPTWQISTEELCCPKYTNAVSVYEVVVLSKENKAEAVQRLKKYLKRQWFMSLTEGVITNRNLKTGWYRGYWCVAAAALVKALKLDDTELKDCKYYPYDMAHFC
ncbi:MAG: DUF1911 domain-containing protein [Candidatus Treponema excrementipullorum]|uniref:DUF1911 domain-containing protein n=2 Tax=Candidatus Treponema excrementipullorum TaxID=2838768 RepID=A0A9E2NZ88_9SPIR|nr:DUF1911 domain-containing protein [Candidatus Treponema excrementipullorum]